MKAKLLIQINEVLIHDYTLIEDEGIGTLVNGAENIGCKGVTMKYEDGEDYNDPPGTYVIVITAPDLATMFKFMDHCEIEVKILT